MAASKPYEPLPFAIGDVVKLKKPHPYTSRLVVPRGQHLARMAQHGHALAIGYVFVFARNGTRKNPGVPPEYCVFFLRFENNLLHGWQR